METKKGEVGSTKMPFLPDCTLYAFLEAIHPSLTAFETVLKHLGVDTFPELVGLGIKDLVENGIPSLVAEQIVHAVQTRPEYNEVSTTPFATLCPTCHHYVDIKAIKTCPSHTYNVFGEIGVGEGVTSKVHCASHHRHGRVAIKMIHAKYAHCGEVESDFLSKMQGSVHVPRLYDTWTDVEGRFCIAMEFIDTTLEDVIVEENTDIVVNRYDVIRQLAQAIDDCHSRHIAHFDIKPSNIGINVNGRVVLLDFGLSETFETIYSAEFQKDVKDGVIKKESVSHRPPEGFTYHADFTEKSDIWAFALVVYDMFARTDLIDTGVFDSPRLMQKNIDDLIWSKMNVFEPFQLDNSIDTVNLILECIRVDPLERPTAKQLIAVTV